MGGEHDDNRSTLIKHGDHPTCFRIKENNVSDQISRTASAGEQHSQLKIAALMLLAYSLSRLIVFVATDIRFDITGLNHFWQLLDLELLKSDLIASLIHQHSQPPAFNFLVGIVLKLFPDSYTTVFSILFHLCSVTGYWFLYRTLNLRGLTTASAFLLASLFILLPSSILYENWFSYTWPIACLMCVAAYCAVQYHLTSRLLYILIFFAILSLICLTRSMFHLIYILFIACMTWLLVARQHRKVMLAIGLAATALVGSLYAKNYVMFGFFGGSSWAGMSTWKMAKCETNNLPPDILQLIRIEEFAPVGFYPSQYRELAESAPQHPTLTNSNKVNGQMNLNHLAYVNISKAYGAAASRCIKENPVKYGIKVVQAWGVFSKPSWEYFFLEQNRKKMMVYIEALSLNHLRFFLENNLLKLPKLYEFPLSSLLLIPFSLLLISVEYSLKVYETFRDSRSRERLLPDTFMVATIWYVGMVGNLMEYGENHRFRVEVGFLIFIAACVAGKELLARLRKNAPQRKT
jgi:hypothetical protein